MKRWMIPLTGVAVFVIALTMASSSAITDQELEGAVDEFYADGSELDFLVPEQSGPCHGIARLYIQRDGTARRVRMLCQGPCPEERQKCMKDKRGNHHGGLREWCDCNRDRQEPEFCHTVGYTPGKAEGGGPPQVLCAGPCPDPDAECLPVLLQEYELQNGGLVQDVSCMCL